MIPHVTAAMRNTPDRDLKLTKVEACVRQIGAAIAAMWLGDHDIAVTLAGAAEDMIDRAESLFAFATDAERIRERGLEKKQVIKHLNRERDWLKHEGSPESMTFELPSAGFMIARAVTKLPPHHGTTSTREFARWWVEYVKFSCFRRAS